VFPGIISALAFSSDYSGVFAAGSFSGTVSLYSEDTGATPMQHVDGIVGGGVTQVRCQDPGVDLADDARQIAFHPLNPQTMFVASRRSSSIQAFDVRDSSQPLAELKREGQTNQRLNFDVDPWGRWFGSGVEVRQNCLNLADEKSGIVRVWDLTDLASGPVFEEKLHDGELLQRWTG